MFKILIPGVACVVTAPVVGEEDYFAGALAEGYQIVYIIAGDGTKYMHRVFGKNTQGEPCFARYKIKEIPGFKMGTDVKEENNFLPAGKVPVVLLMEIQKFFKAVIAKHGNGRGLEAMIWIMYNEERGYFLHVPNQKVGGASVEYDWADLPAKSRIIVDIHSHADFNAFFSGTDDRDDSNTIRYSGVIGFNNRPDPMMIFRWNFGETKIPMNVTDIFAYPTPVVQDTPEEWLDKVKTNSYTTPTQYGGHGGWHGGYGSHYDGYGGHYNGHRSGGYSHHGGYTGNIPSQNPPEARATLVKPETEPTPVYSSVQVARDSVAPKPWTAPKPANATIIGKRGGIDGWFLDDGGFISFGMWEQRYPAAKHEQAEARRKAAMNAEAAKVVGGQQGTRPLELTGPTGPSSPMNRLESQQREASGSDFLFPHQQQSQLEKEKPRNNDEPASEHKLNGSNTSLKSSDVSTPSSQSASQPNSNSPSSSYHFPRHKVVQEKMDKEYREAMGGQTQPIKLPSVTGTSNSQAPSTVRSASPLTQEQLDLLTGETDSATTSTKPSGECTDPLAIFTEKVKASFKARTEAYLAGTTEEGTPTLMPINGQQGVTNPDTEAELDALQATYQQELRESQNALQTGRKAALLEDTTDADGRAPMGVVPVLVETPRLQPRTPATSTPSDFRDRYMEGSRSLPVTAGQPAQGSSEVTPLGESFSVPRLQTRSADHSQVAATPVAPQLVRKTPTTTPSNAGYSGYLGEGVGKSTNPLHGSFVDDWLARRRGGVDLPSLPESAIERMHNRAQQEDLIRESEDAAELAELQEGAKVLFERQVGDEDIHIFPDNMIVLRVAGDDLPSFNADVIDYGLKPAGAKAVIEIGVKTIQAYGREALKRKLVSDLFEILDEGEKLPVFRTLVASLPESARDDLATNGL